MRKHMTMPPIGIDFDYNEFRAVQFDSFGKPRAIATIPRSGRRHLAPNSEELASFAKVLAQRGFTGNKVVLPVPKRHASFHILSLPSASTGAPVHQLAKNEVQRAGAHKTNDLQVGLWTQSPKEPASKHQSPTYTVACETQPLDDLIAAFEEAQLLPVVVEPIETALVRSALHHPEFVDDAIHCIVELGWDHSWVVITLGATPVYTRQIDLGSSRVRRQLIDDHAMPCNAIPRLFNMNEPQGEEASRSGRILSSLLTPMLSGIVQQLDIALTYVSQQHRFAPFGVVFRSGYFSHNDQTARAIANRTGMPTIAMEPIPYDSVDQITQFERDHSQRLSIATGLALGAVA